MEIPDLTTFTFKKTIPKRFDTNVFIDNTEVSFYEKAVDGKTISAGLYKLHNKEMYIAWGDKASDACGAHALVFINPPIIGNGCINFTLTDSEIIFKEGEKTYPYPLSGK